MLFEKDNMVQHWERSTFLAGGLDDTLNCLGLGGKKRCFTEFLQRIVASLVRDVKWQVLKRLEIT